VKAKMTEQFCNFPFAQRLQDMFGNYNALFCELSSNEYAAWLV